MPTPRSLRLDPELHAVGETTELPEALQRALAWWVVAELIRRHPDKLEMHEEHPGGGQYDCLTIYDRAAYAAHGSAELPLVYVNVTGHITHSDWFREQHEDEGDDGRFNWYEVLCAEDRRSYVIEQLEAVSGLPSPKSTPPTTSRSIGIRLLARFAELTAFTRQSSWDLRTVRHERDLEQFMVPSPGWRDGQFWCVRDRDRPHALIDIYAGLAWQVAQGDGGTDLLDAYRRNGSTLDATARLVLPAVT